jgi:RNA polymerase sigma factor (sigma-70 family)
MMHQTRRSFPTEEEIATLYERHARNVLTFIRTRISSTEEAEDLLVEVFLGAMQNGDLPRMSMSDQLTWLRHVARNKIIDRYRQQSRRPAHLSVDDVAELLYDDEREPEALALLNEDYARLRAHLATLPPLQQEVLRLRFAQDLSTKEIAQRLAKTDNAIRMLLSRTVNRLRTLYEKGGR